ncbi:hypothetical protein COV20_03725 [Candidatus Woesearchaeota archaeon CG10_big_fil_rev_8_21_14_0_10_45_16]|nr:MAG: hypothetical protein COV20_03725 [Candidatus Woesearchaeota archaeon CG10_big_fil_rev_8_21_14_0_10_45_16]
MVDQKSSFRKISKDKYVVAAIITFLIFSLGLTLGIVLKDYQYGLIEEVNMEQDVKFYSTQLQYAYLNAFSDLDNCAVLRTTLQEAVVELADSLQQVIEQEEGQPGDIRSQVVLRRYALDNLRYWLLAKQSNQRCDLNTVLVLYFHTPEKNCPSCENQGAILTHFKNVFEERFLVFPINLDLRSEEPMIEIVKSQFNVTKVPTLVIGDQKYEGVISKEQLQNIICNSLHDAPECT